ncbi:hypothetical protein ABKV19_025484 [Rosa sericea]
MTSGSSRNGSSWTNALGLEERCTSCKVKCPSWLNTSFIVGHVDWGRVQHGLGFWEVCSVENMSFSSQALPTLFCRIFQPHVIHILNFTLVCCCMTECEMNSLRVIFK